MCLVRIFAGYLIDCAHLMFLGIIENFSNIVASQNPDLIDMKIKDPA